MKHRVAIYSLFCLFLFIVPVTAEDDEKDPFRNLSFDEACEAAKSEGKIVMIDFYAVWCGPCKMLDRTTWKDKKVQKLLREKTVALKVDAEKNRELSRKYGVRAYPTIVFLKPDGKEIDRLIGYRGPSQFIGYAKDIVR